VRQGKLENYMEQASVAAKRSPDAETQVGSVLVKNVSGAVVATGFNGFVRGAPDHVLPATRPEKYEFMMHSEENIIYNCCKEGISTNNCTLVCTLTPCVRCTRALWQCGITNIIAKQKYRGFDEILVLRDIKVIEETTAEGFIKLTYMGHP
jgi:dCMP deaminase